MNDMTTGSPFRVLWRFSIPMLLSMIFQQLYNIADSVIVGNFVGVDALAAVGASTPITVLFIAVATGCSIGCTVVISQIFGAKKYSTMKTAISTAVISIGILSIFLTILGILFCNPLMRMMNTPANIFSDSALYLRIYIFGLIFLFMYNTATAVFNALGDSKTPLYFLIFSSLLNVILDILFVRNFGMGVGGSAWATFIAQGLASVLSMTVLINRMKKIPSEKTKTYFDRSLLARISKIAVPSICQQSFISIGQLFVQGLINSYGSVVVAGYSAAFRINTFAIMSVTTLAGSLSSFTGQNIGAGKPERIKKGLFAGMVIAQGFSVMVILVFAFFGENLIGAFVKASAGREVVGVGMSFLRTVSPFYVVIAAKLVCDGVLRGTGSMKEFMIATFSDLLVRVGVSYLFAYLFGYTGIWWSFPLGWMVGALLSCGFYLKGGWKHKAI